jgi:hypothetical protein
METNEETNDTRTAESKTESLTKVLKDLVRDLLITYPELKENLDSRLVNVCAGNEEEIAAAIESLTEHFRKVFPERFFDILYENEDIFAQESEVNTEFLPGINYKELWAANISDSTRSTLWKYLQLILFSTVSDVSSGDSFGDTAKLFEAINEDEFRRKLEETMQNMHEMFETAKEGEEDGEASGKPDINLGGIPNAEAIHEHVAGMMNGKLGALAQEIAEETARDLNIDMEDASSVSDVFQNLLKNPTKLMGMVKNVGSKLDEKIKSGEIKESELLAEASDLMKKMKEMPGMGDIQQLMGKMGLGGKGAKMNTGAMQAHMEQAMRLAKRKEEMRNRAEKKSFPTEASLTPEELATKTAAAEKAMQELLAMEDEEHFVFKGAEPAERSSRIQPKSKNKSKNKKKKKGKST